MSTKPDQTSQPSEHATDVASAGLLGDSVYYYRNSLRALKRKMEDDLRRSMARYERLSRQGHPCTTAQGKWIDFQNRILAMIREELSPNNPIIRERKK